MGFNAITFFSTVVDEEFSVEVEDAVAVKGNSAVIR